MQGLHVDVKCPGRLNIYPAAYLTTMPDHRGFQSGRNTEQLFDHKTQSQLCTLAVTYCVCAKLLIHFTAA
jgi:hypothetical protein